MLKSKSTVLGGMVAATALAIGLTSIGAQPAHAQASQLIYSGGGTLGELFYRDDFSCYGYNDANPVVNNGGTSNGSTENPSGTVAFTNDCSGAAVNSSVEFLYAGVGSGDGKLALVTGVPANLVSGSARQSTGPDSNPHPGGGSAGLGYYGSISATGFYTPQGAGSTAFPSIQMGGSDDPLTSSGDLVTYYTAGNPGGGCSTGTETANCFGPIAQFPTLVTGVAIGFGGTDGNGAALVLKGKKPAGVLPGYTTYMVLDPNTVCGLETGDYSTWDQLDSENTPAYKLNGGVKLGSGNLYVTYRSDKSGTSFINSNALLNECGSVSHPGNNAAITHHFPDKWITDSGASYNSTTGVWTSNDNFYVALATDGDLPTWWHGGSGNGGVETLLSSGGANVGTIGYVSPGFVNGYSSSGADPTLPAPDAAALQVWETFVTAGKTAVFEQPTVKAVSAIMAKAAVPLFTAGSCTTATGWAAGTSPDGVCAHNPVNWGVVNPTPATASTYPIGGFTFFDLYSCYSTQTEVNDLVSTGKGGVVGTTQGLWYWHMKQSSATGKLGTVLPADGFSTLPGAWTSAIEKLLTSDKVTEIRPASSTARFSDGSTCHSGA